MTTAAPAAGNGEVSVSDDDAIADAEVPDVRDQTVLIYRLGSLGDTVVSLPCFHKVAQRYPNAHRIVLTNTPVSRTAPRLADVLDGSGLVHGTLEYPTSLRSLRVAVDLWRRVTALRADTLVYLAAPRGQLALIRDLAFFHACGIRRIIGAPFGRDLQTMRVDAQTGEEEHECERLVRSIACLGPVDLDDQSVWSLGLGAHERKEAQAFLGAMAGRSFVALSMGCKAPENDWGERNWAALVDVMRQTVPDLRLVVVGAAADAPRAEALAAGRDLPFLNLCGRTSPRQTAAVLSRAALFVGHDSGPLHLASACGTPSVGIYSNRHRPHKWHPYGLHTHVIHPAGPIGSVTVEEVHDAIARRLGVAVSDRVPEPCHAEGS